LIFYNAAQVFNTGQLPCSAM